MWGETEGEGYGEMETQTNNHYSISTKYGIESRELDERYKGYVALLLAWRPLAQSPSSSGLQHYSQHNSQHNS